MLFSHRSDVLCCQLHCSSKFKVNKRTRWNATYDISLLCNTIHLKFFFTYCWDLLLHNHDVISPKTSVAALAMREYSFRRASFIAFQKHTSYAYPIWARDFLLLHLCIKLWATLLWSWICFWIFPSKIWNQYQSFWLNLCKYINIVDS